MENALITVEKPAFSDVFHRVKVKTYEVERSICVKNWRGFLAVRGAFWYTNIRKQGQRRPVHGTVRGVPLQSILVRREYPRCTKGNMPAAAKMSAGCVLVLGGRLSPPSSCGLASPDFCPPAGPVEFFGSKNAAAARQTRQPGSRPATRITPLRGVSAPKNHIDPCTPRARKENYERPDQTICWNSKRAMVNQ